MKARLEEISYLTALLEEPIEFNRMIFMSSWWRDGEEGEEEESLSDTIEPNKYYVNKSLRNDITKNNISMQSILIGFSYMTTSHTNIMQYVATLFLS